MKKITVKDILEKVPCSEWTEERLQAKIGEGKTLPEILDLSGVEDKDKIWCVTRFLDDKTNRAFAIWCARQGKTNVKEITEYINVIEKYYNGKATKEELKKADSSSYWAADRAANEASYRTAYWVADGAAYGSAERKEQVAYLRKVLGQRKVEEGEV